MIEKVYSKNRYFVFICNNFIGDRRELMSQSDKCCEQTNMERRIKIISFDKEEKMLNPKNELQMIFQKQKQTLPTYDTKRVGGADHMPIFSSTVRLCDGREFMGDNQLSKTIAEMRAAEIALPFAVIKEDYRPEGGMSETKNSPKMSMTDHIIILIDLENRPNATDELCKAIDVFSVNIIEYLSKNSPLVNSPVYSGVVRKIVPSSRKDSSDIGMILDIAFYFSQNPKKLIIVTGDHFGDTVVECCQKGWFDCGETDVKSFSVVKDCITDLTSKSAMNDVD